MYNPKLKVSDSPFKSHNTLYFKIRLISQQNKHQVLAVNNKPVSIFTGHSSTKNNMHLPQQEKKKKKRKNNNKT